MRKRFSGAVSSLFILVAIFVLVNGCSKTPLGPAAATPPSVVTYGLISAVTPTSALSGGIVTNGNGGVVTANGVCWSSVNTTPTVSDSKTTDTINVNGYNSRITGLTASTTYYLRAYASNSGGVGYGAVIKFTTGGPGTTLSTTVSTVAGNASTFGSVNGTGAAALLNGPNSICFNPTTGTLYISETFNNAIRTMTTGGAVSSYNNPGLGLVNGQLANALFYGPANVAFDAQGNVYVADMGNNCIRKITTAGVVTTLAGNGLNGYADGAPTVAMFSSPTGVTVDAQGNVYVADRGNSLIRKISPNGTVVTVCGAISAAGVIQTAVHGFIDGASNVAQFYGPTAVALDPTGATLYVADGNNHAIRMVTISNGNVSTLAGGNVQVNLLGTPNSLVCDAAGNLFEADETGRVLEITAAHTLYVLGGGVNTQGYVDGPGPLSHFNSPQGVALDAQGNVYVADFNNNVIRKITLKFQ